MGISFMTALTIQGWPDLSETATGPSGIVCEAAKDASGKWSPWISLWKDGTPHIMPLVSFPATYATAEDAAAYAKDVVRQIRELDVLAAVSNTGGEGA